MRTPPHFPYYPTLLNICACKVFDSQGCCSVTFLKLCRYSYVRSRWSRVNVYHLLLFLGHRLSLYETIPYLPSTQHISAFSGSNGCAPFLDCCQFFGAGRQLLEEIAEFEAECTWIERPKVQNRPCRSIRIYGPSFCRSRMEAE